MIAASALINGLGGEKERWTEQSKQFTEQTERYVCRSKLVLHLPEPDLAFKRPF